MRKMCPTACSRLVSAAIFIAVGVVQLIAGIILLNSQYVYLLAIPNFWTALANVSVGCLVGIAASVWKHSSKQRAAKYIARYHLMVALLFSAVIVNTTTTAILVLGEGNALLSITLEEKGTLVSEILGYAYAASVVSPVLSATVATLSILAGCCPERTSPTPVVKVSKPKSRKGLSENDSTLYSWVYTNNGVSGAPKTARSKRMTSSPNWMCPGVDDEARTPEVFTPVSPMFAQPQAGRGARLQPCRLALDAPLPSPVTVPSTPFNSPMAGEMVPLRVARTLPRGHRLGIPVRSPLVPYDRRLSRSLNAKPLRCHSKKQSYRPSERPDNRKVLFSSFRGGSRARSLKGRIFGDSRDIDRVQLHRVKSEGLHPKLTLESIRELPDEDNSPFTPSSACTSGYGSSPDTLHNVSEFNRYSMLRPARDSLFSRDTTPKKVWNQQSIHKRPLQSEASVSSQIFDPDSLVGLSDLELIAMHYKNKNTWKILRKRASDSQNVLSVKEKDPTTEE